MEGKVSFKVNEALNNLPFYRQRSNQYICKTCIELLKKRCGVIEQLKKLESLLEERYNSLDSPRQSGLKRSASEDVIFTPKKVRKDSDDPTAGKVPPPSSVILCSTSQKS